MKKTLKIEENHITREDGNNHCRRGGGFTQKEKRRQRKDYKESGMSLHKRKKKV